MTRKYIYVREELYNHNLKKIMESKRTIAEMLKVFKPIGWILPIILIIMGIACFIISLLWKEYSWIPSIIVAFAMPSWFYIPDRFLYKEDVRAKELEKIYEIYDDYVLSIASVIKKHIKTYEKLMKLKAECEEIIKEYEEKQARIKKRIFELIIVAPLSTFVVSIISPSEIYSIFIAIAGIILIGYIYLFIELILKLIPKLSQDYKKDKYLLELINELDYSQKALDSIFKE